jgi:hypothetical protein
MNVWKKTVTACAAAGAGLVLAVVPATSALAGTGTTVGQTGTPLDYVSNSGGDEGVQTDAVMPTGGIVTSFQTQSGGCPFHTGVFDFQVLRPLGNNQYQVLGDTGNQTDPCDGQLHSYPVSIPVQAGDVLGVYTVSTWQGVLGFSNPGLISTIPQPAVGGTITLPSSKAVTFDESATLTPSASGLAAKLVSDAGHLAPGTALSDQATAIQAAVNAGDTTTACTGITEFLGLVKAQNGKKLSHANATLLKTDANNLAAALGC